MAMNSMEARAAAAFDNMIKGQLTPDQQRELAVRLLEDDESFHAFFAAVEERAAAGGGGASCEQARERLAFLGAQK